MIVGFTGPKGAGKTYAAMILMRRWGYTRRSFADPMRRIMEAVDPIVGAYVDRPGPVRYNEAVTLHGYDQAKRLYPEIRRFLQRLGTEGGRQVFGEDVWVELATRDLRPDTALTRAAGMQSRQRVVFDDVRFDNEARAIKYRLGGIIIRLDGRGETGDSHASEAGVDPELVDHVIDNSVGDHGGRLESMLGDILYDTDLARRIRRGWDVV